MLILGLVGMYFDGAVVFVTSQTLLLRLALAILCHMHLKDFAFKDGISNEVNHLTFYVL